MPEAPTIYIVDDDEPIRRALLSVGTLLDHPVRAFSSAEDFLQAELGDVPGCLVLDVKMPGISGLELQRRLLDAGVRLPIVMISGHADVRIAVEAMTLGAVTLLEKPFGLEELLGHVRKALEKDRQIRDLQGDESDVKARLAALTPKEREVLDLIADGRTNREMAEGLGLSIRAVEDRRARLMKKVQARTVAELVRILIGR
jgi:FixJ family two-component response regulator